MTEELLAQHLESPSGTGRDDPENQNLRPALTALADASYRQGPFSLGNLGRLLSDVVAYERGEPVERAHLARQFVEAYAEATATANELRRTLTAANG